MHRWGLLESASLPDDVLARRERYTLEWLARSKRFSALLLKPVTTHPSLSISMLSITGRGHQTLATGIWDQRPRAHAPAFIFDEDGLTAAVPAADPTILFKDGDGTVTTESAMLPPAYAHAFQVTHRQYDAGHAELVTRSAIHKEIIAFLSMNRRTS